MSELASIEKVVFLESVVLFSYCTADELLRIAAIASEQRFAPGDVLYERNAPATTLYCVVSGEIVVDRVGGDATLETQYAGVRVTGDGGTRR